MKAPLFFYDIAKIAASSCDLIRVGSSFLTGAAGCVPPLPPPPTLLLVTLLTTGAACGGGFGAAAADVELKSVTGGKMVLGLEL